MVVPFAHAQIAGAMQAKCVNNMRGFLTALPAYLADHSGVLPRSDYERNNTACEVRIQLAPYMSGVERETPAETYKATLKILCPVDGWGFGFNSFVSELPVARFSQPGSLVYMMDICNGSRWVRMATFRGLPQDLREAVPKPHQSGVHIGFLDGHIEWALVSSLTIAQFTKDTPFFAKEHSTAFVADPQFDR